MRTIQFFLITAVIYFDRIKYKFKRLTYFDLSLSLIFLDQLVVLIRFQTINNKIKINIQKMNFSLILQISPDLSEDVHETPRSPTQLVCLQKTQSKGLIKLPITATLMPSFTLNGAPSIGMIAIKSLLDENPLVIEIITIDDATVQLFQFFCQSNCTVFDFTAMWASYMQLSFFWTLK